MILEHDAGRLCRLARGVADVETFDAEGVEVLGREVERFHQRAGARVLRPFLGQQLGELDLGALDAHVEPRSPRLARLVLRGDARPALRRQRVDERLVHRMAEHEQRRHAALEIVLGDEGLQHLHLGVLSLHVGLAQTGGVVDVDREVGPVAQVPAAAHHRQVHARATALHLHGKDVGVLARHAGVVLHRLLVQHARQRAELVADLGRLLELQRVGVRHHLRLQRVHHLLLLAEQETLGVAHVATHGPEQRLIWYSRQGRVRLLKTVSSQVRRRNTFCSRWIESFTAQADGYGPK